MAGRPRSRAHSGRLAAIQALIALVVVGLSSVAQGAPQGPLGARVQRAAAPTKGKLLIADRRIRGGGWAESVVLLVDHDSAGSMGLIINRPSRVKLSEVLPSRKDVERRGVDLWVGGPVQPTRILVLARAREHLLDGVPVFDEVQLIQTTRGLSRAFGMGIPPAAVRAYAGYAGWGRGQLEAEIARGDWHVVEAEVATVFSQEPADLWKKLIAQAAGRWVRRARVTQAPM